MNTIRFNELIQRLRNGEAERVNLSFYGGDHLIDVYKDVARSKWYTTKATNSSEHGNCPCWEYDSLEHLQQWHEENGCPVWFDCDKLIVVKKERKNIV